MDLQKLSYFVSVAKNLNFTKAADECFIAQTAMSRYIANLEEELNATLFYRNNRSVLLTPAGKVFYEEAVKLLDQYAEALRRTKNAAKGFEGTLRIGFGQYERPLISQAIQIFHERYPKIEIFFEQSSYDQLMENISTGQVDLMVCLSSLVKSSSSLVIKDLIAAAPGIVALKSHPLASLNGVTAEQLKDETFISLNENKDPGALSGFQNFCVEQGFFPKDVVMVSSLETKLLMVEAGMGLAFIPRFMADCIAQSLVFLDLAEPIHDYSNTEGYVAAYSPANQNQTAKLIFDILDSSLFDD